LLAEWWEETEKDREQNYSSTLLWSESISLFLNKYSLLSVFYLGLPDPFQWNWRVKKIKSCHEIYIFNFQGTRKENIWMCIEFVHTLGVYFYKKIIIIKV
jgi:hypothetical protein